MIPLIALIMLIPAGLFSGMLTVLDAAFCQPESELFWSWYCTQTKSSSFGMLLKRLVTGWLPSILVSVWQNVVVTRTLYFVALAECVAISLDGVDRRITALYFTAMMKRLHLGGKCVASY